MTATTRHEAGPAEGDRLLAVEGEVVAVLPVLPDVCRQLTESAAHVERAVVGVCGDFQAISDTSRRSAARTGEFAQTSAGVGMRHLTDAARATIGRLLERSEEAHARLIETAAKVEAIEAEVGRIEQVIRKVDRVSVSIKILSLNAQIEGARAGAAGRAFAVVASETGKVANEAAEMNQSIQNVTARLGAEVRTIATEIRSRVAAGRGDVESARGEVGATLGLLAEASEQLGAAVTAAARDAEQVTQAVGRAVVALQFQDAVSQRVGHAVETLREVEAALARHLAAAPGPIGAEWGDRLRRRFTMAAEHDALRGDSGPAADDIELF